MKYDDLTLIKFVDNELDDSLMSEIRDEMLLDKELGARLNVVSLISNDNIIRAQKYGQTLLQNSQSNIEVSKIHENIKILIDNFEPSLKGSLLILLNEIKTRYKLRAAIISSIIVVLVSVNLTPQVMMRGVDFLDNESASLVIPVNFESKLV